MQRIQQVQKDNADNATLQLLNGVEQKMGMVPNLISTMANSTAVANAYLGFSQNLSSGTLPARVREQIALVVGEANSCGYCVAAHTVMGKLAGLSKEETVEARKGLASSRAEQAAIEFAGKIVEKRGLVSDEDLREVRDAGYDEGQIGEIVANVALNTFTNYFNHVAGTEVDFPAAPELVGAQ